MSNAQLTIVNASAARKGGTKAQMSPAQAASAAQLTVLSQGYRALSDVQQQSYRDICKVSTLATNGKNAYVALNMVRWQCGDDPLTNCPQFPDSFAAAPSATLSAARAGGAGGAFQLDLVADGYAGRVMVWASRGVSSGRDARSIADDELRLVAVLEGLTPGHVALSSDFLSVFPAPAVGSRVFVKLVAVGPNGFRGPSVPLTQRVTVTTSELTVTE